MWLNNGELEKAQLASSMVEQAEREKPKIHPKADDFKKTMPIPR
jgi:hypothetical protein